MKFFYILSVWYFVDGDLYERYGFFPSYEACYEAMLKVDAAIKYEGGKLDEMRCTNTGVLSASLRPKARGEG